MIASVPGASNQGEKSKSPFPRSLRLLRHADFERVYKQGKRHFSASLTAFYLRRTDTDKEREGKEQRTDEEAKAVRPMRSKVPEAKGLRVGFTVGRALGGAVQRNRMKRRLREAVRLSHPPVEVNADVVINPKKSLLTIDFQAVMNEVQRAFVVIEKNCKENRAASSGSRKPEAESRT